MKKNLFYTFLVLFIITAIITLLGIINLIEIKDTYLSKLFYILIIELVGGVIALFRKTVFFDDKSNEMQKENREDFINNSLLITNNDDAREKVRKIYLDANNIGGDLYSLHYSPNQKDVLKNNEDFLNTILKTQVTKKKLHFYRYVVLDEVNDIENYANSFFENKTNNLDLKLIVPIEGDFFARRFAFKYILPTSFILFKDKCAYYSTRLDYDGDEFIGVYTEDKIILEKLELLWDSISENNHINPKPIKLSNKNDIQKYRSELIINPLLTKVQRISSLILNVDDKILHIGLFGSIVNYLLKGPQVSNSSEVNQDCDYDLFIVVEENSNIKKLQEQIESILISDSEKFHVEWGSNEEDYYPFRKKQTIEIEIYKKGDSTFICNNNKGKSRKLLGYSFFENYYPLYSPENQNIKDLIKYPSKPLSLLERKELFINGDKGLLDMSDNLHKIKENKTDGRRIASHLIRNYYWVLVGKRPRNYETAIKFLEKTTPRLAIIHSYAIENNYSENTIDILINYLTNTFNSELKFRCDIYDSLKALHYNNTFGAFRDYRSEANFLINHGKEYDLKSLNILDIGCGNGNLALSLQEISSTEGTNLSYVGIDKSKEMIDIAKSKNIPHCKFITDDALNFNWGYGKFNVIYISYFIFQTLPSYYHIKEFIERAKNWLHEDGAIIFDFIEEDIYRSKFESSVKVEKEVSEWIYCPTTNFSDNIGDRTFQCNFLRKDDKFSIGSISNEYLYMTSNLLSLLLTSKSSPLITNGSIINQKDDYKKICRYFVN